MDIFRISGFVEDKNLAKVKRLLSGLVYDLKDEPLIGTTLDKKPKNGATVRAKHPGGARGIILNGLKAGQTITTQEAKAKLIAAGFPEASKSHYTVLWHLVQDRVLRRVKPGVYQLNKPKE